MINYHGLNFQEIQFPGEAITFVGEFSWDPQFPLCFGTENGKLRLGNLAREDIRPPFLVVESGEAINGVAFANDLIAVSTRSEVILLRLESSGHLCEQFRYEGGAHGVISTPSGRIIAPLGPHGLLVVGIRGNDTYRKEVIPRGRNFYFYKLASLGMTDSGNELVAGACRQGGIIALSIEPEETVSSPTVFRSADLDIIDVCSIGIADRPHAVASLGSDCSIHLSDDIVRDTNPKTLRFSQLEGTAYAIRSANGHLFVLTSRGLYILYQLARRFLEGQTLEGFSMVQFLESDAFDVFIANENRLFLLRPGSVNTTYVDDLSADSSTTAVVRQPMLDAQTWEESLAVEMETVLV